MRNKKRGYRYLVLWIANMCNLDCSYCYAKSSFNGSKMEWDIADRGLQYLEPDGIVVLAGGEPLLNFELIEKIYAKLRNSGFLGKISIQTNGTLITDDIAKKLSIMDIKIGISLDGLNHINEISRGLTKEVINGIKKLEKFNKVVSINCVLTDKNIDGIERLIERLYMFENIVGIGLDLLRVTNKNSDIPPTYEKIYENLKKMYLKSKMLGKIFKKTIAIREIENAKYRMEKKYCSCNYCYSSIGETAVILPNGDIYPCSSLVGKKEYFMGNIKTEKLKNIKLSTGKYEFCKICEHNDYCRGACPSRIIMNSISGLEHSDCDLRKAIFKILKDEKKFRERKK